MGCIARGGGNGQMHLGFRSRVVQAAFLWCTCDARGASACIVRPSPVVVPVLSPRRRRHWLGWVRAGSCSHSAVKVSKPLMGDPGLSRRRLGDGLGTGACLWTLMGNGDASDMLTAATRCTCRGKPRGRAWPRFTTGGVQNGETFREAFGGYRLKNTAGKGSVRL